LNNYGVVYDLRSDKAVVLTQNGNFAMIQRREDMFLGQQIAYEAKDIYHLKNNYIKYASICAGVAAVCVLVFIFLRTIPGSADVYGFVSVDINPSVEFCINDDYKVLEVDALNSDATKLLKNIKVVNRPIEVVIVEIVRESKKYGYITSEEKADVLISASLKGENNETDSSDGVVGSSKIDRLLEEIKRGIEGYDSNIAGETVRLTFKERDIAHKENISMGKYYMFLRLKEQGKDISIDEINTMKLSDLMYAVDFKNNNSPLQAIGDTKSTTIATSIPEEISKASQMPENSAEPTPVITPKESILRDENTKPSDSLPKFTAEATSKPSIDALTASSKPSNTPSGQRIIERDKRLKLKHYNEKQSLLSKAARWDFVLENMGNESIDMKDVKVRYYFKEDEGKNVNSSVYFYSLGEEKKDVKCKICNIAKSDVANRYLELTFENGSVSKGESAWVFGAIFRDDWTKFNQEDDYSFSDKSSTFSEWDKMTVYISDELVWGIEPF